MPEHIKLDFTLKEWGDLMGHLGFVRGCMVNANEFPGDIKPGSFEATIDENREWCKKLIERSEFFDA